MSSPDRVYVAVIGAGGVGREFLSQLRQLQIIHPHLSLVLISLTTKSLFTEDFNHTLSLTSWLSDLSASTQPALSPQQILDYLSRVPGKRVLIDNTSSQELANTYPSFLIKGISIVTPNKKAFSGPLALWRDIFSSTSSATHPNRGLVYHESSVGAGLPVISTLNDLVQTGDQVVRIEGVFSGTMSFLFNSFAPAQGQGGKWSTEVTKAKGLGFTEPDPRDDLNGVDVARKLVILARIVGLEIENTNVFPVQSLIPGPLEQISSAEEFMRRLGDFDADMDAVKDEAKSEGKVVRYVGSIDVETKKLRVGVEKFEIMHPIAALRGSDNLISFYTKRYGSNPLIIQGAGAGGAVTAMGVSADLLKVLQRVSS